MATKPQRVNLCGYAMFNHIWMKGIGVRVRLTENNKTNKKTHEKTLIFIQRFCSVAVV